MIGNLVLKNALDRTKIMATDVGQKGRRLDYVIGTIRLPRIQTGRTDGKRIGKKRAVASTKKRKKAKNRETKVGKGIGRKETVGRVRIAKARNMIGRTIEINLSIDRNLSTSDQDLDRPRTKGKLGMFRKKLKK